MTSAGRRQWLSPNCLFMASVKIEINDSSNGMYENKPTAHEREILYKSFFQKDQDYKNRITSNKLLANLFLSISQTVQRNNSH